MKLLIPPPIYLLLALGLMWLLKHYMPLVSFQGFPWNIIGWSLIGIALAGDLYALALFLKARTTFNPIKPHNSTQLVVTGSYRFSRNPMYLGMVLILGGWGLVLGAVSPFIVIPFFMWVLTEMQIKPEEAILTERFGVEYQTYLRQVRRWL
ncbi:MAG: isoprenylcysteine carboxylmethyltransferase family protein [Thiofilum sp.]|uniref:methyltransferase family protein n=1 Tax=Thiofilum sp. TaxID=2212733 RepID=UPI0025E35324|nr:isoprenylcysteine carboxylmethyltransferase family protein [Thiofilum sp.]MBK8452635.1 isoprenylcysteine carboxylmethyltransferase family protein [Thiofilum sp.]